ncbi:MAG: S1 RNA-binding domain-containing protein [Tepidisphaeraceae bacterium]
MHVSDLSWTKKVGHPSEVLKKGDDVEAVVLSVDQEKQRIALSLKHLQEDPWTSVIPTHYRPGMVIKGQVTKIANFGVFVELEAGLEGLLHVSEIADQKIEKPEDVLKVGQDVEVKILRVDTDERKIGLSLKRASGPRKKPSAKRSVPNATSRVASAAVWNKPQTLSGRVRSPF